MALLLYLLVILVWLVAFAGLGCVALALVKLFLTGPPVLPTPGAFCAMPPRPLSNLPTSDRFRFIPHTLRHHLVSS